MQPNRHFGNFTHPQTHFGRPKLLGKCLVIVKFIRESEDIVAGFTCPAGSSVTCLGKCNHVGTSFFLWKILIEKI